jgi:hypothetical protein
MLCFRCGSPVDDSSKQCENCGQNLVTTTSHDPDGFADLQRKLRETGRDWLKAAPFRLGELVNGRYEVVDILGAGALGVVYKTHDQQLAADHAVKVISGEFLPDHVARERFVGAVKETALIAHENLVRIVDAGCDGDRCYVVSQFLEGLSLRKILDLRRQKGQRFAIGEVEPLVSQLCRALGGGGQAVVHGGLKPANIVILPDLLKVTDLGLYRAIPLEAFLAAQRGAGDAFHYLAPEVRRRAEVDARADVFSIAAIVAELLGGRLYGGQEIHLSEVEDSIPGEVDDVLNRALSADPERRYEHPFALADALALALSGLPPHPLHAAPPASQSGPLELVAALNLNGEEEEEATTNRRTEAERGVQHAGDQVAPALGDSRAGEGASTSGTTLVIPPPGGQAGQKQEAVQVTQQLSLAEVEFEEDASESDDVTFLEDPSPGAGPFVGLGPDDSTPVAAIEAAAARARDVLAGRDSVSELGADEPTQQVDPNAILAAAHLAAVEDDEEHLFAGRPVGWAEAAADASGRRPDAQLIVDASTARSDAESSAGAPVVVDLAGEIVAGGAPPTASSHSRRRSASIKAATPIQPVAPEVLNVDAVPPPLERTQIARPAASASEGMLTFSVFLLAMAVVGGGSMTLYLHYQDPSRSALQDVTESHVAGGGQIPPEVAPLVSSKGKTGDAGQGTLAAQTDVGPRDVSAAAHQADVAASQTAPAALLKSVQAKPSVPDKKSRGGELSARKQPIETVDLEQATSAHPPKAGAHKSQAPTVSSGARSTAASTPRTALRHDAGPKISAKQPGNTAGRCHAGMVYIGGSAQDDGVCIDRYEAPGRGITPHQVSLARARAACEDRGLRLCSAKEWMRACAGQFPYGQSYDAERCNTGGRKPLPSGSKSLCRSRFGIYDLSGNVAEWVAEGVAMGGDGQATGAAAGCAARAKSGVTTGYRCCADPKWEGL